MAYEHKEGQGSLFKNDKQNDRQPDFKGTIMIGGTTYEVAAWSRTSQNGREYLSLQASLPRQTDGVQQGGYQSKPAYQAPRPQQPAQAAAEPAAPAPTYEDLPVFGEDNEDLPF